MDYGTPPPTQPPTQPQPPTPEPAAKKPEKPAQQPQQRWRRAEPPKLVDAPPTPDTRSRSRYTLSLLGVALICLGHAAVYLYVSSTVNLPSGLRIMTEWVPINFFGAVWLLAGVAALWFAVRRRPGWLAVGVGFAIVGIFGTFYVVGVIQALLIGELGSSYRQVIFAGIYAGIELLIWGAVPGGHHRKKGAEPDRTPDPAGPHYPLTAAAIAAHPVPLPPDPAAAEPPDDGAGE